MESERVRFTLRLRPAVHKRLVAEARREGRSATCLVERYVDEMLLTLAALRASEREGLIP